MTQSTSPSTTLGERWRDRSCGGEVVAAEGQNGMLGLWGFLWWRWRDKGDDETTTGKMLGCAAAMAIQRRSKETKRSICTRITMGGLGCSEDDRNGGVTKTGNGEEG